jgi:hypothetical protein
VNLVRGQTSDCVDRIGHLRSVHTPQFWLSTWRRLRQPTDYLRQREIEASSFAGLRFDEAP